MNASRAMASETSQPLRHPVPSGNRCQLGAVKRALAKMAKDEHRRFGDNQGERSEQSNEKNLAGH